MLDLTGVPVLVVGGGRVAHRKIEGLLKAGADVTVVAPNGDRFDPRRCRFGSSSRYETADLDACEIGDHGHRRPGGQRRCRGRRHGPGIWVNSADDPANCTFTLPAVARDGAVTVAVSTGGASPALASHLRGEIERWLGQIGAADAAVALAAQRAELQASGVSTESVDWSDRSERAASTNLTITLWSSGAHRVPRNTPHAAPGGR